MPGKGFFYQVKLRLVTVCCLRATMRNKGLSDTDAVIISTMILILHQLNLRSGYNHKHKLFYRALCVLAKPNVIQASSEQREYAKKHY